MITIKEASISDYKEIYDMIVEFAAFQRTPEKVSISLNQMKASSNEFKALIVRENERAIGFATYYFGFSSWSGKHLFLDDLYLDDKHRKSGIGSRIMDQLEAIANEKDCKSMRWLVSKWNESAIAFYKKRGSLIEDSEMTCFLKID